MNSERIVVDKRALAEYFTSLKLSFKDAVALNINSETIINAAIQFYGENDYYYRKNILRILKRNSNNIKVHFNIIASSRDCTGSNESIIINTDDRSKEIGKERTSTGSTKVTDDENDFPVTVKQIFDESYKRYNHSRVLPW